MIFHIHTLHRGRFIWILLGCLFAAGFLLSYVQVSEIVKILILLFCIPVILFLAVKVSLQPSTWDLQTDRLHIDKAGKVYEVSFENLAYIKNHLRSGGNLIAIYKNQKGTPIRIWRNKLFVKNDDFDAMMQEFRNRQIEIVIG